MQMQYVTNGTHIYGVTTEIQLSSFLNSGFELVSKPTVIKPKEVKQEIKIEQTTISKEPEETKLAKTDINRMNASKAREVAIQYGLSVDEEESGASIKRRLVELLIK